MDLTIKEKLEADIKAGKEYLKMKEDAFNKKKEYKELFYIFISLSFLIYSFLFVNSLPNIFIAGIFGITSLVSIYLLLVNITKYSLRLITRDFIKHSDKSLKINEKIKELDELNKIEKLDSNIEIEKAA